MMKNLAPICLFTYSRLNETKRTIDCLKNNHLADQSDLYIFSDGPKNHLVAENVDSVRKYLKKITGFRSVTIIESENNRGLATSIISGVSLIIKIKGKVIVLEDDLISSRNFLSFMNEALEFYEGNHKIFSISGFTLRLPSLKNYSKDFYLGYRASSWGWGTWADRWDQVDWEVREYAAFQQNPFQKLKFMRGGSDMPGMLKKQMEGRIDSWAIRWCFDQYKKNMLTVFPATSKIKNIGIGEHATHTKKTKRFETSLDIGGKIKFHFDNYPLIDKKLLKEFKNNSSIIRRLKDKLL